MPTTSPVRVSASSPARWATPKSVSFARSPRDAGSGTITFCGLTSRWMTPRSCAWASASASASPIRRTSRSDSSSAASSWRERAPLDELGDQVAVRRLAARVEQADRHDRVVVEPGDRARLALGALRPAAGGDDLDRHGAAEALVARPNAEAARAEPRPAGSGPSRRPRACGRPCQRSSAVAPPAFPARKGHLPGRKGSAGGREARTTRGHTVVRAAGAGTSPLLSFFDEDDEPRTRAPRRPDRHAAPRHGGRTPCGPPDRQLARPRLLVPRIVALR